MIKHVEVTRNGRVLEVKLNRPKVNAIDVQTSRELGDAFALLRDDPELWAGILTGGGDRILINDRKLDNNRDTAFVINIERNKGIKHVKL